MGRPKTCLVIGAGAGLGMHIGRRFARAGYVACLARRSDRAGLDAAVEKIEGEGGAARGFLLNATQPDAIEDLVHEIESTVGDVDVAVYNLGAQIGDRSLQDTSLKAFRMGHELGCAGLFRLAKAATPAMVSRGHGNLLVTSATAALRGNKGQHSHAAAMGGRRMLCQTLAHELGPKGVHVCHFVVDGAVDAPDTLGKMLGPTKFAAYKAFKGSDGILQPADAAESFFHVASQPRSVWTNEIDLRPFSETAWYNS